MQTFNLIGKEVILIKETTKRKEVKLLKSPVILKAMELSQKSN